MPGLGRRAERPQRGEPAAGTDKASSRLEAAPSRDRVGPPPGTLVGVWVPRAVPTYSPDARGDGGPSVSREVLGLLRNGLSCYATFNAIISCFISYVMLYSITCHVALCYYMMSLVLHGHTILDYHNLVSYRPVWSSLVYSAVLPSGNLWFHPSRFMFLRGYSFPRHGSLHVFWPESLNCVDYYFIHVGNLPCWLRLAKSSLCIHNKVQMGPAPGRFEPVRVNLWCFESLSSRGSSMQECFFLFVVFFSFPQILAQTTCLGNFYIPQRGCSGNRV